MGVSYPGANYLSDCFLFTLLALGLSHSLDNFLVPMLSKAYHVLLLLSSQYTHIMFEWND